MNKLRLDDGEDYIPSAEIDARIAEMGDYYTDYFNGEEFVLMTVLQGAGMFAMDLGKSIRNLEIINDRTEVESMSGTKTNGTAGIRISPKIPITGRDLLIVEDIYHTGLSMNRLISSVRQWDPASLAVASLIDNPTARLPEYSELDCDDLQVGFQIEDVFVVGRGLDWNEKYRMMPHVSKAHNIAEPGQPDLWVPVVSQEPALSGFGV